MIREMLRFIASDDLDGDQYMYSYDLFVTVFIENLSWRYKFERQQELYSSNEQGRQENE